MVDDQIMDNNSITKPTPLPRTSLIKNKDDENLYANTSQEDLPSTKRKQSRMSLEAVKMRNEVQKLEKSFRKMMSKRRNIAPESCPAPLDLQSSSQDQDVFHSIAFDSPFGSEEKFQFPKVDSDSENDSFYTTSELPPPYPPPDLPDESTYDELTSGTSSDVPCSYYSPGSDNSIYEELSSYISKSFHEEKRSNSWSFYDGAEGIKDPLKPQPVEEVILREKPASRASSQTSSVILQFDPLFEKKSGNPFNDPTIMSFLSTVEPNVDFEYPETSVSPPPVPPRRFDSESNLKADAPVKKSSIIRWSSVKRVARFVTENIEKRKVEKVVESTAENYGNSGDVYVPLVLHHSGVIYRPGPVKRWAVLAQRKLTVFLNKDSPDVKETIPVDSILSLKICPDNRISVEGEQVSCFEVSLSGKSQPLLLGTPSASERHVWMRKLLESITPAFPAKLSLDYTKAGRCFSKDGISSEWSLSAILLHQRFLHLVPTNGTLLTADLRKARYIALQENDLTTCERKGRVLLLDLQDRTLYLQMDVDAETAAWEASIRSAALQTGPSLDQQQLTKDDVPTIVDKCIKFVHTHGIQVIFRASSHSLFPGSISEGIYRRSGSSTAIERLLSLFRRDAWSIQLTRTDYSEFDVASVLKRFFRDLPESLFITELHLPLREITELSNEGEKLQRYRTILKQLPRINYLTARRLMGHLYFIDQLNEKNLMNIDNLAAIWGPTLMHVQESVSLDPNWSRVESTVIKDLITHYPGLFDVPESELMREKTILSVLEDFHKNGNAAHVGIKPSAGDLKIWVYLNDANSGDCVSVTVTPTKQVSALLTELSSRMPGSPPAHTLCLLEVISGGRMRRPLHHTERVLECVLRWSGWDEADRRDNCLVVVTEHEYPLRELLRYVGCGGVAGEMKWADAKSRSFRGVFVELAGGGTVGVFKDKSCAVRLDGWHLEETIWYLGHESRRNPHTGWSITFIGKNDKPRSKEKPYFGWTLAGTTEDLRLKWMASMMNALYPAGILMPAVLIE